MYAPPGSPRLPILGWRDLLGGTWFALPGPATLPCGWSALPDVGTRPLVGYGTRTGRLAGGVGRVANLVMGRGIAP